MDESNTRSGGVVFSLCPSGLSVWENCDLIDCSDFTTCMLSENSCYSFESWAMLPSDPLLILKVLVYAALLTNLPFVILSWVDIILIYVSILAMQHHYSFNSTPLNIFYGHNVEMLLVDKRTITFFTLRLMRDRRKHGSSHVSKTNPSHPIFILGSLIPENYM